jgi:hypothetical protein
LPQFRHRLAIDLAVLQAYGYFRVAEPVLAMLTVDFLVRLQRDALA